MKLEPIRKGTLENGIRLVTEHIPSVRSVCIGFWLLGGSRIEKSEESGISHFIEHMLFKGTGSRSAYDIAKEIDSLGGHLDAFTSKEYTCLLATVLDEHLPKALDILTDQLKNSLFSEQEVERERKVILEEIKMIEDTPDEYVHDMCIQQFWPQQAMGRSIIGSRENVRGFTKNDLEAYFQNNFLPGQMIVAAAGNLDHDYIFDLLQEKNLFSLRPKNGQSISWAPPTAHHQILHFPRKLEQIHICMLIEGLPQNHELRFSGYLMNAILGGGMSSRLFQKIREQRGLAYAVFSSFSAFQDTGLVSIYAGTCPESLKDAVSVILEELTILQDEKVSEEELQNAKNQLKGNLMLGLESTANRMSKLARQEMYFGRNFSFNEILSQIESVTSENLRELARKLFGPKKYSLTSLGEIKGQDWPPK